ncbi:MAG: hypothetical protein K9K66_04035 [Desulfarculaceae bacterium]|nr:hypothetical protein [Desulfarculaceae bacterium]MCF8073211.1 hypothetical protein [Desulfarculaceae bacterium]MCF8100807.1 hypothetical protein [Desulfarculaceae bacterium]
MPFYLPILTWALALAGGAAALGAAVMKGMGLLSPPWAGRLYGLAYALMGLSVVLFIIRGFTG